MESNHDYHVRRAREELDLAYRSDRRAVSAAHLHLSALHMARLRLSMNSAVSAPASAAV